MRNAETECANAFDEMNKNHQNGGKKVGGREIKWRAVKCNSQICIRQEDDEHWMKLIFFMCLLVFVEFTLNYISVFRIQTKIDNIRNKVFNLIWNVESCNRHLYSFFKIAESCIQRIIHIKMSLANPTNPSHIHYIIIPQHQHESKKIWNKKIRKFSFIWNNDDCYGFVAVILCIHEWREFGK